MRRRRSRVSLGVSVSLVSLAVLATSCGSDDIGDFFSSGASGQGAGAGNQAGHGAGRAGASGSSAGKGPETGGDENGGNSGDAGASTDGGTGGSTAGVGGSQAGGAGRGGGSGAAGSAGKAGAGGNAGSAGKGGNAGSSGTGGSGGSSGKGGSAGSSGKGGNAGSAGSGGNSGGAGNGGTAGTGGSGGTAGASGKAGSGGTSGSAGSGGASCLDNGACGPSEYCAKPNCGANAEGHCAARPMSCTGTKQATVCGCDGITYHDSCLLHANGQNSGPGSAGECPKAADSTLTCTSADETSCAAKGGLCGYKAELGCAAIPTINKGLCWILPATCPGSDDQVAHSCAGDPQSCTSLCAVIKSGQNYTLPANCN